MISVIVPIYNEEKILKADSAYFKGLAKRAELIFVDGESSDMSARIAGEYGLVIPGKKGRALQMNCGAKFSKKDILLFLHADTRISFDALASVERKITEGGFSGGCLTQRIDKKGIIYRMIEGFGNLRSRITKVFYGDQGIFVKKELFLGLGGFPEVPVMEDILFARRLRAVTRPVVLADEIIVSPRRWEKRGLTKTILLYSILNILFWLNVPLGKIKKVYPDLR